MEEVEEESDQKEEDEDIKNFSMIIFFIYSQMIFFLNSRSWFYNE